MSRSGGIIARIWHGLQKSLMRESQVVKMVGEDHLGNKYFEKLADPARNRRASRWVEPRDASQSADPTFIPEVPMEWEAWLRRRRNNPPTQEEIDMNYAIGLRTQMYAKELEEKMNSSREPAATNKSYTETITQGHFTSEFPKYEDYEQTPGESQTRKKHQEK